MTMAEVEVLTQYWRDHPPAHVLAAAYLGYAPGTSASPSPDLISLFGADPTASCPQPIRLH